MFLIKTYLDKSNIHGVGLFAGEKIAEGKVVYVSNPDLDLFISDEEMEGLDENSQNTIRHYGYKDKKIEKWHLAFDDIRFCNHSKESNINMGENGLVASRDIKEGEELLQDYGEFEDIREEIND